MDANAIERTLERGYKAGIRIERDDDMGAPWEERDGHGPVSEWTTRDKLPGERVLCTDRAHKRYYDWAEAIKIAKREGWDAEPYGGTKGQKAERAVAADFEHLRAWCNDEWYWVGYVVKVYDERGNEIGEDSLWGIDDEEYAVSEALESAKRIAEDHYDGRRDEWRQAMHEARERKAWEARDVVTL